MVIEIDADLEAAITRQARSEGISTEELAITALRRQFLATSPIVPRDEWERRLLQSGTDCGVSLDDEAVSSEGIYD